MAMNRRGFVKLVLASATGAVATPMLQQSLFGKNFSESESLATNSLRDRAARKGVVFGSAVRGKQLMTDPPFAALFREQCGILTPELELKWDALRPAPDQFDFSGADRLLDFATSHGMLFRGHTLVWEIALPPWFDGYVTSSNVERVLTGHISSVLRHYAGKVSSWDVVNEAVQVQDGRADGLKVTPWLRLMGPQYIETAFRAAHEADPKAKLIYNENWIEPDDAGSEKRRRAVLSLLTDLKKRNVPVHGLGIQSHIFADAHVTGPNFYHFLQEVEDLGLSIQVTEMDVRDRHVPADLQTRDRLVAEQYERYLSFLLQFKSVKTIITWGLSDRYTWISYKNMYADGLPVRALPYDADLKPTLSCESMARAFDHALRR
jgi:endo-1,4-beta-xylanase